MSDAFDRLLAGLDAPMIVVTTAAGGERAGCMVGFHAQASIDPRRLAVWLSKANHTYRVALHASHLAVHALTEDDHDLADRFGGETGDAVDKFAGLSWTAGPGGVPLLDALPHRTVIDRITLLDDGGDHVLWVGRPVAGGPVASGGGPRFRPLRLHHVSGLTPGHAADEADADGSA